MASKRQNKVLVLSFSIHNIVMPAVFEILIIFFPLFRFFLFGIRFGGE